MTVKDNYMQAERTGVAASTAQLVCLLSAGGQQQWGGRAFQAAGEGSGGSAQRPALPPHTPAG